MLLFTSHVCSRAGTNFLQFHLYLKVSNVYPFNKTWYSTPQERHQVIVQSSMEYLRSLKVMGISALVAKGHKDSHHWNTQGSKGACEPPESNGCQWWKVGWGGRQWRKHLWNCVGKTWDFCGAHPTISLFIYLQPKTHIINWLPRIFNFVT